jgi:hypothetical protein
MLQAIESYRHKNYQFNWRLGCTQVKKKEYKQ